MMVRDCGVVVGATIRPPCTSSAAAARPTRHRDVVPAPLKSGASIAARAKAAWGGQKIVRRGDT